MSRPERIYKIALFGVTGCGKSSIINLLAEKQIADVTTGVEACTRRARWYPISLGEKRFRLWDTMGFNQVIAKGENPLSPYEQAHALLRNLQDGVDLILLCTRRDGINASLRNLYWLLNSFFYGGHAPIALILTHFDTSDILPDQWWEGNRAAIANRCGIPQTIPHACITTILSYPVCDQSKQALKALLLAHATTPTPVHLDLSDTTVMGSLNVHCQLSVPDAAALAERFTSHKQPFHAILFGEAGVGKSSVINLLVDRQVADISSGLKSCTLDSRSYKVNTGLHQFLIWDTVGLNGMTNDMLGKVTENVIGKAMENAVRLIRDLHAQGGVDLLVYCRKNDRVSPAELHTFRLFHEILCEGQIPVAFIVTHLDSKKQMEEWWEKNGEDLVKACNMKMNAVVGHACITSQALDDEDDFKLKDRLSLSRQLVQTMLEDSITFGSAFTKDEGTWVMSFLRKLAEMVRAVNPNSPKKIALNSKTLMDRCGLTKEQAEELIRLLNARG